MKIWLEKDEKTIVYFPYASLVRDAAKGIKGFAGITVDKRIGTYTGRNINDLSVEQFNEHKRMVFEGFRKGTTPIMLATKAFGMGVDVNDVKNVYHYAVSGNLCDYVQEIGRAARKNSVTMAIFTPLISNKSGKNFIPIFLFRNLSIGISIQTPQQRIKLRLCHLFANTFTPDKR